MARAAARLRRHSDVGSTASLYVRTSDARRESRKSGVECRGALGVATGGRDGREGKSGASRSRLNASWHQVGGTSGGACAAARRESREELVVREDSGCRVASPRARGQCVW